MVDETKKVPNLSPAGVAAVVQREVRLATALRANLTRRKTQARQRAVGDAAASVRGEHAAGCIVEKD